MPKNMQIWERQDLPPGLNYFGHCVFDHATDRLAPHTHTGMEFIILTRGMDTYSVDGRTYEIHGGEAFVTRPQQLHASGRSHQGIGEYLWFQLDLACRDGFLGLAAEPAGILQAALGGVKDHVIPVQARLMRTLNSCFKHLKGGGNHFLTGNLLANFLYHMTVELAADDASQTTIGRIQAFVDAELQTPLSVRQVASRFQISASSLQHAFCKRTGQTFRDYINSRRIEQAKALLAGGRSITDTAMLTGYATPNYFATIFKRYTQCTPSDYRKTLTDCLR